MKRAFNSLIMQTVGFEPLELIFNAGYLSMENYVCTIKEELVKASDDENVTFELSVTDLNQFLNTWKESDASFSFIDEFCLEDY